MKINDVHIDNWKAPGSEWWADVKEHPTEPLIEATIKFTLSWEEYRKLMDEHTELPSGENVALIGRDKPEDSKK